MPVFSTSFYIDIYYTNDFLKKTTVLILDAFAEKSSIKGWNLPFEKSSTLEMTLGCLNKLFGVNTISGFL